MIPGAIDLGIITVLFFILGMIKPQWPLFFMKTPSRFIIVVVTTILFMITATLYGEGLRREKLEKAAKQPISQSTVPVPVPVPVPEKPAIK
jgi:VIT1/CCC1 family predicted Fe2+/Mn2+ transporter